MKKVLVILFMLVILLLSGVVAVLTVAPDQARAQWVAWGLPEQYVDQAVDMVNQAIASLNQPGEEPFREHLEASGSIEAEEVHIASVVSGRVVAVLTDKGDWVKAGDPLIRLDDADLKAQLEQAQAGVKAAQASLAQVQAGPTDAQVAAAKAQLEQAQAELKAAQDALTNAEEARRDLWELDVQIHQVQAQIKQAAHAIEQAKAKAAQAKVMQDSFRGDMSDLGRTQFKMYGKQIEAAQEGVKAAE
ncbi:MAG TPA: biotin/lipoyl-binding protein, partial [Anaerolineae bacterium]|nr:biotin/lipoyl-binding protein [Anaerolineae bacterium]